MRSKPGLLLHPPVFGSTMKRGRMIINPTAKDFSGDVTFTRASAANYFDSSGILQSAAINTPRFDSVISTGAYLGYRSEGARTNLLLWNRDFTNAAWVKLLGTAAKTATGIDGVANSASTLTATSDGATYLQTITAAASSRSFAIYVKRITGTGAISVTQDGITYTTITVTSSWTRCATLNASVLNATPGIKIATSGDVIAVDYGSFEAGAFVSSPIATTTASVARSADLAVISTINTKPWFNPNQGVFYAEYLNEGDSSFSNVFFVDDGTVNNFLRIASTAAAVFGASVVSGSTVGDTSSAVTANLNMRAAFAYKANDFYLISNLSTASTDNSGALPTGLITGRIGHATSGVTPFFGTIKNLIVYPSRRANANLAGAVA